MTLLLRLYWEFFKTGLFAVGGGLATLPFLYQIGAKTGWYDEAILADMVAVGESTPGPIGVNMATYTGFTTAGTVGGIVATLGLVTPCLVIILIIARFLKAFKENEKVQRVFLGLRPAVCALILAAGIRVMRIALFDASGGLSAAAVVIFAALFAAIYRLKWHPIIFIVISAVIGVVFSLGV